MLIYRSRSETISHFKRNFASREFEKDLIICEKTIGPLSRGNWKFTFRE